MKHRSRARFLLEGIEGAFVTLLVVPSWPLTRRWLGNWGSSARERERARPGDGLVSQCETIYTRAITVEATPTRLWRWVVQFGLGRAGFYSYELLERLVGIPVENVEDVVEDFQSLAVGDEVKLHPSAPGIPVGLLEPERYVCFGTVPGETSSVEVPDPNRSWSIYIDSVADSASASRLILRGCVEPLRRPTLAKRLSQALEEPIDFVMEQRMLRSLKRLAESEA